jgi:predicted DNA-binding transcriptional regulator AlpA
MRTRPGELWTVHELARHLKVGVRTVWRWAAAGKLPPPIRTGINGRIVRWWAEDIQTSLQTVCPSNSSSEEE